MFLGNIITMSNYHIRPVTENINRYVFEQILAH